VQVKKVLWSEAVRTRIESGRAHFLARANLRAISAGTASVLLDVAASDRPDLVVVSSEPLELSLLEICSRIRDDPRTRAIPILAVARLGEPGRVLKQAGCTEVVDEEISAQALQEKIAAMMGLRLRKHPRFPVVLPVARGRIFHEFLGYSNAVSEGGMGFDTLARIREGEYLPLRIYRNTEERPIAATGRVAGVRANIDTGIGYAVGVEFLRMAQTDRSRLLELFPRDASVTWGSDAPPDVPPSQPTGV
jgi:CheY-like chemotaxis protein